MIRRIGPTEGSVGRAATGVRALSPRSRTPGGRRVSEPETDPDPARLATAISFGPLNQQPREQYLPPPGHRRERFPRLACYVARSYPPALQRHSGADRSVYAQPLTVLAVFCRQHPKRFVHGIPIAAGPAGSGVD